MSLTRTPLRWLGGKQRLSRLLRGLLSQKLGQATTYFEPFLGGGSVFFTVNPSSAVLGDVNPDLINFYRFLANAPAELRQTAEGMDSDGRLRTYMDARNEFNNGAAGMRRAALFLYLNRTGFNGIWRVNRKGAYTVPFGYRRLSLISEEDWQWASAVLRTADIRCADYRVTLDGVQQGDIVFLDPPYFDSSRRELFSRYTLAGFDWKDHQRLHEEVQRLTALGANVLLTIRDDPSVWELYKEFRIDWTCVRSTVGAKGPHTRVSDLIVRNFD